MIAFISESTRLVFVDFICSPLLHACKSLPYVSGIQVCVVAGEVSRGVGVASGVGAGVTGNRVGHPLPHGRSNLHHQTSTNHQTYNLRTLTMHQDQVELGPTSMGGKLMFIITTFPYYVPFS